VAIVIDSKLYNADSKVLFLIFNDASFLVAKYIFTESDKQFPIKFFRLFISSFRKTFNNYTEISQINNPKKFLYQSLSSIFL